MTVAPFSSNANQICLNSGKIGLRFSSSAAYAADGEKKTVYPAFLESQIFPCEDNLDSCTHLSREQVCTDGLLFQREIAFEEGNPSMLRLRLSIGNQSGRDIELERMTLLGLSDIPGLFPGTDCRDWVVFRQGRMKNDLPAVCRLGDFGPAFSDAVSRLRETGGIDGGQAAANRIVSDQATVLCAGKDGGESVLLGYLTGDSQLVETVLELDQGHQCTGLSSASLYQARLPAGCTAKSEWLRIWLGGGPLEALDRYAREKGKIYQARKRPVPLSVFCTWYYYGLSVTQQDMLRDMDGLRKRGIPFDVFQLDEGWEVALGDWRVNDKFTMSHREIAQEMKRNGFIPGIWTSPFIAHETAPVVLEHPEWILRHRDGSPCLFPMNGTVYQVLDITHPGVLQWVEELYAFLRESGFLYHKLDFTRAPVIEGDAVFYDSTVPRARAYRNAVKAVRRGIGEESYLLICGGLYDPVIGLADGQRAGSDVLSMWNDPFGQGGKAAPFTIKQAVLRAWMNAWWDNDPDALMVRRRSAPERGLTLTYGLLNEEEVKTSALNQYFSGGLVCATEPMDQIEDDRLFVLRHLLPIVPVKSVPRDLFQGKRYPAVIDTQVLNRGYHTVTVINWEDETDWLPELYLDEGFVDQLDNGRTYRVCEFFSGMVTEGVRKGDRIPSPVIKPHGSALFKVEEERDLPSVVASTGHFSFGGEVKRLELSGKTLYFETDYAFSCPVRYTIALPLHMHCTALPQYCAVFGGRLEICLPGRGSYRLEIPLEEDTPFVPLK